MANLLGQVTIPPSGKVQLSTGLPANVDPNLFVQLLQLQNNGSNGMRAGDVTVSSTRGIKISQSGGSDNVAPTYIYSTMISDWWMWGVAGDVLDFLYII